MKLALGPTLKRLGVKQSKLADDLGISRGYVSDLVSGNKLPSTALLAQIAETLGVPIGELWEDPQAPPAPTGFAESDAAPFVIRSPDRLRQLVQILAPDIGHAATYRVTRTHGALGLIAGDVLLVDIKREPQPGDVVLATHWLQSGAGMTLICRWAMPYLVPADPAEPLLASGRPDGRVAIVGVVRASYRPSAALEPT